MAIRACKKTLAVRGTRFHGKPPTPDRPAARSWQEPSARDSSGVNRADAQAYPAVMPP